MGPEYCANCARCAEPCAAGLTGRNGRRCPQEEHRPLTVEGAALWRLLQKFGTWSGGGMGAPQRPDRAEIRRRLEAEVPAWIVDELIDAFEPAWLKFRAAADAARRKRRGRDAAPKTRGRIRPQSAEGDAT